MSILAQLFNLPFIIASERKERACTPKCLPGVGNKNRALLHAGVAISFIFYAS
jgi:hypothetical protein